MRSAIVGLTVLMSFVLFSFAMLRLINIAPDDRAPAFGTAMVVGEIALAVVATLLAFRVVSRPWLEVTQGVLLLLLGQRLWGVWAYFESNWTAATWLHVLSLDVAPPLVITAALHLLARLPAGANADYSEPGVSDATRPLPILLKPLLLFLASVTLVFSLLDFAMGQDLFGRGTPALLTSLLAMGTALTTFLFAIRLQNKHLCAATIVLAILTESTRLARAWAIPGVLSGMDAGGWLITVFVALGPPAGIFGLALYSLRSLPRANKR